MKLFRPRIVFSLLLVLMQFYATAQIDESMIPTALKTRLTNKEKVADIIEEVDAYYQNGRNLSAVDLRAYKKWNRWAFLAMRRTMPDGRLASYPELNDQAFRVVDSMYGTTLRMAKANWDTLSKISDLESAAARINSQRSFSTYRSYGGWVSLGPSSFFSPPPGFITNGPGIGRVDRIAFHPTNPNIFYVCTPNGGIYKTTNGGAAWTDIGEGLPGGAAFVEVAPTNGNIIYVLAGSGDGAEFTAISWGTYNVLLESSRMYKSTDGGVTWSKLAPFVSAGIANRMVGFNAAISPLDPDIIFVATTEGLQRSQDGGLSWELVLPATSGSDPIYDVEYARINDGTRIYASSRSQVFRSFQSGDFGTFVSSSFNLPLPAANALQRIELAVKFEPLNVVSGGTVDKVYALVGNVSGNLPAGNFTGLYLSRDRGATFNLLTSQPNILSSALDGSGNDNQAFYDLALCVKPTDTATVVTGGIYPWITTNQGQSFSIMIDGASSNIPSNRYIHADIHDLQYNPLDNKLYACTDGGLFVSADDGANWSSLANGIANTQVHRMTMLDGDGDGYVDEVAALCGTQDNGTSLRTNSGVWTKVGGGDGFGVAFMGNSNSFSYMQNTRLCTSTNGGATSNSRINGLSMNSFITSNYDISGKLYVGSDSAVLRTTDNWVTYDTAAAINSTNFITACPSNAQRLYGSPRNQSNLNVSTDDGVNWTTISGTTGWPSSSVGSLRITDCEPLPTNSSLIYVTFSGFVANNKVLRSSNAGSSWTNISYNLPNTPVHCIAVGVEGLYVGTDIGVFFLKAGSTIWTPFFTGMPPVCVLELKLNSNGNIYAATYGRGMWSASRYSDCDENISISGVRRGIQFYEVNSTANVTSTSPGSANDKLMVSSNGVINLNPGFEVKRGSVFQGYLSPCGGGIPTALRFSSSPDEEFMRSVIEIDQVAQSRIGIGQEVGYQVVQDGIFIRLPHEGELQVLLTDTSSRAEALIVPPVKIISGFYKVLTGTLGMTVKVLLDGQPLTPVRFPDSVNSFSRF